MEKKIVSKNMLLKMKRKNGGIYICIGSTFVSLKGHRG